MHHFIYRDGTLFAEEVAIEDIAAAIGTPFYCYSDATLRHHYSALDEALRTAKIGDHMICYSLKANSNLGVIATLAAQGAGADIVSEGELHRALKAGIAPEKIVFSGVGKTAQEMRAALHIGIAQFNVESLSELDVLSAVAVAMDKTANIALRVNPDIDAQTHEKITTGKAENKFGIAWQNAPAAYAHAASLPNIRAIGIDIHIGSQIVALAPFRAAFMKMAELLKQLREQGHTITQLDIGGGLGVPYESDNTPPPDLKNYTELIAETLGDSGCRIILEPGRLIAANAGILVTSIIRCKYGAAKNFMVVDAAMTELMRPTLYGAHHDIKPVREINGDEKIWDIVGPVCESGDFLGLARQLPTLPMGAQLAIFTAGAYGATLGSAYNTRPQAPEILVAGNQFEIVRTRPDYDQMMQLERLPNWLASK